jgi:hypothetical protein
MKECSSTCYKYRWGSRAKGEMPDVCNWTQSASEPCDCLENVGARAFHKPVRLCACRIIDLPLITKQQALNISQTLVTFNSSNGHPNKLCVLFEGLTRHFDKICTLTSITFLHKCPESVSQKQSIYSEMEVCCVLKQVINIVWHYRAFTRKNSFFVGVHIHWSIIRVT